MRRHMHASVLICGPAYALPVSLLLHYGDTYQPPTSGAYEHYAPQDPPKFNQSHAVPVALLVQITSSPSFERQGH